MGKKKYDWTVLVGGLYDALADKAEGLDIHQIVEVLEVPKHIAYETIRRLRMELGEGDSIAVPYRQDGRRCVYFLTSDGSRNSDFTNWSKTHAKSNVARLDMVIASHQAIINAHDGRSTVAKDGKLIVKVLSRVQQDITDLLLDDEATV